MLAASSPPGDAVRQDAARQDPDDVKPRMATQEVAAAAQKVTKIMTPKKRQSLLAVKTLRK
jgi:hypothetical protein